MAKGKYFLFIAITVATVIFFGALYFVFSNFFQKSLPVLPANALDILKLSPTQKFTHLTFGTTTVNLFTAETPDAWKQGLSGTDSLGVDDGLLFIFFYSGYYKFWMKDMKYPLDIIWISDEYRVVHIEENLLPAVNPQVYEPKEDALYVLEVNAGFSEKNNLKVGDMVELF